MILGIAITVIAIVAIMFGFANAFADFRNADASRGSEFAIMFGQGTKTGYQSVPLLIAAFVCSIVAAVFALISAFLPGKLSMIGFGVVVVLMLFAGIVYFCTPALFLAANPTTIRSDDLPVNAGVGPIGMGIVSIVGALGSLYCVRLTMKA